MCYLYFNTKFHEMLFSNNRDWKEVREMRRQHIAVIGDSLQLAGAAFLATRTDVIAFDKQHLQQGTSLLLNGLAVVFHLQPFCRWLGAGGHPAPVDADDTHPAAAVWFEFRVVAQVGDVSARAQRSIHDGLSDNPCL